MALAPINAIAAAAQHAEGGAGDLPRQHQQADETRSEPGPVPLAATGGRRGRGYGLAHCWRRSHRGHSTEKCTPPTNSGCCWSTSNQMRNLVACSRSFESQIKEKKKERNQFHVFFGFSVFPRNTWAAFITQESGSCLFAPVAAKKSTWSRDPRSSLLKVRRAQVASSR